MGLTVAAFIRQAALQASAIVTGTASVGAASEPEPDRVVVLGSEPERDYHVVDGERVYRR